MIKIDKRFTENLIEKALQSDRKRTTFNFHKELSDSLQRMINTMNTDTYVQPHKHQNPDKREVFILIKGKALVVEFDDQGVVSDYILLDRMAESYGCEIEPGSWHTIICLENNTLLYEVKDGPYDAFTDKKFAKWAPKEGDLNCLAYNKKIAKELGV